MARTVFTNVTTNEISDTFPQVNGKIQVDITGVMGGADVITYYKSNDGTPIIIRSCSWMTSLGDTLSNGADGGYEFLNNREVFFQIINSSATTNISLDFDVE